MKLRIIYTLFALTFGAFIFLNNSGGRATVTLQGNTGAPNDNSSGNQTCVACHNSGNFVVTPTVELLDANGTATTDNLVSGETYTVKVNVNSTESPSGYGFQIVALNAADGIDGTPINTWTVPTTSTNVQLATLTNGRQYAEQVSTSSSKEFVMEWTAPASGDVTFYLSGNATNGNGGTSGDNGVSTSTAFSIGTTATNELEKNLAVEIFPNPVTDVISLRTNAEKTNTYDLILVNQNGQQMKSEKITITAGQNVSTLPVANLAAGIYNLVLSDGKNQVVKKILKF